MTGGGRGDLLLPIPERSPRALLSLVAAFSFPRPSTPTSSVYALSHTRSIQAAPLSSLSFSSQGHVSKSLGSDNSVLSHFSLQSWG